MAIFHFALQTVRRAEGRSAVAAAAYRAGERLTDERTGETHDHRARGGVMASGLVGWCGSRNALWDAAEAAERHPRAVVAREVVVALPHELPDAERLRLVEDFGAWLRRRHGVVVDWAVHGPGRGDDRNHHGHLLITSRRALDGRMGEKTREMDTRPQGPSHVAAWRAEWADACNRALERAKIAARVDHRSLASRGEAREPAEHLGPAATALERQGRRSRTGDRNRRGRRRNELRPEIDAELAAAAAERRALFATAVCPPAPRGHRPNVPSKTTAAGRQIVRAAGKAAEQFVEVVLLDDRIPSGPRRER